MPLSPSGCLPPRPPGAEEPSPQTCALDGGDRALDCGWRRRVPTPPARPLRAPLPLHDRADFDRTAKTGCGDPCSQLDGSVEVVGLVDEVAVQRFLGVDERPVRGDRVAVVAVSGGCNPFPGVTPGLTLML